jgi:hypothetical protein
MEKMEKIEKIECSIILNDKYENNLPFKMVEAIKYKKEVCLDHVRHKKAEIEEWWIPSKKICYNNYGKLNVYRSDHSQAGKPCFGRNCPLNTGSCDDKTKKQLIEKYKRQEVAYQKELERSRNMANEQNVTLDPKFVENLEDILVCTEKAKDLQNSDDRKSNKRMTVYETCGITDFSYINNIVTVLRELTSAEKTDVEYQLGLDSPTYIISTP